MTGSTIWHGLHGVFLVVFVVIAAVWMVAEINQSANRRAEATVDDRGSRAFLAVSRIPGIVLAIVAVKVVTGATIRPHSLDSWLAITLFAGGVALRLWSFRTLGRYFTFTVQTSSDQPIISTGPYRVLRHPSYTGVLLIITGIGFALGNWLSVAALTVTAIVGLLYRIRVEEQALEAQLGDRYREFEASRKRLIPFVW